MTAPSTATAITPAPSRLRKLALRLLVVVSVGFLVAQLLNYSAATMKARQMHAGFWLGMLHGAVMPCTWPALAMGQEVEVYAANNTGRTYNLGYTLGVNACGALFFGLLYRRLHRLSMFKLQTPSNKE